jgi:hypothetical protein
MYRSMRASVEKFDVAKDVCGPVDDDLLYGDATSDAHETSAAQLKRGLGSPPNQSESS